MMLINELTDASRKLFIALWQDRGNWGGTPLWGGNVGGSKEDRGNLSDLKKRGLVNTFKSDGLDWVSFTPEGESLGATINYLNA